MVWLLGLLFLNWKHATLRGESIHLNLFLSFAPLLVLALEGSPEHGGKARVWARAAAIAACVFSLLTVQRAVAPGSLESSLIRAARMARANLETLFRPMDYIRAMGRREAEVRAAHRLKRLPEIVGTDSVDVFGNFPLQALASGLNYTPRPVFQSFSAYSAPLMRLNEEFYFSPKAPRYVLLQLSPIDNRFPPLEDSQLLRDLLAACDSVGVEGSTILLSLNHWWPGVPRLLRQGTAHPGERIELAAFREENLWMEIDLRPSLAGHASRLFFKPPLVYLRVWAGPGAPDPGHLFEAPPPMLSAGFLASPLLLETSDVVKWYTGGAIARPAAVSIELEPGTERFWETDISYRIWTMAGPPGRAATYPRSESANGPEVGNHQR
jgi:hypothetical protein